MDRGRRSRASMALCVALGGVDRARALRRLASRPGSSARRGSPTTSATPSWSGIAMGFAVIPIIFAISEDAFSNVPRDLVAGSLALGANRWQTVTRVVLPTASPGIFSAIMVGFGRAVGETMIVLMATGNTPILSTEPVQRLPHAVGQHRRRDSRGAARRHALPHALPRRAAALRDDLPRQHRRRAGAPAPAPPLRAALDGDRDATHGAAPQAIAALLHLDHAPARWRSTC